MNEVGKKNNDPLCWVNRERRKRRIEETEIN